MMISEYNSDYLYSRSKIWLSDRSLDKMQSTELSIFDIHPEIIAEIIMKFGDRHIIQIIELLSSTNSILRSIVFKSVEYIESLTVNTNSYIEQRISPGWLRKLLSTFRMLSTLDISIISEYQLEITMFNRDILCNLVHLSLDCYHAYTLRKHDGDIDIDRVDIPAMANLRILRISYDEDNDNEYDYTSLFSSAGNCPHLELDESLFPNLEVLIQRGMVLDNISDFKHLSTLEIVYISGDDIPVDYLSGSNVTELTILSTEGGDDVCLDVTNIKSLYTDQKFSLINTDNIIVYTCYELDLSIDSSKMSSLETLIFHTGNRYDIYTGEYIPYYPDLSKAPRLYPNLKSVFLISDNILSVDNNNPGSIGIGNSEDKFKRFDYSIYSEDMLYPVIPDKHSLRDFNPFYQHFELYTKVEDARPRYKYLGPYV